MLYFLSQDLGLHCRQELLFNCWKSEVRSNNAKMTRNFMCTLLMAVLKDLAVFI